MAWHMNFCIYRVYICLSANINQLEIKLQKEKLKRIKIRKRKENLPFSETSLSGPSFSGASIFGRDPACHNFSLPLSAARTPPVSPSSSSSRALFLRPNRSSRAPRVRPTRTQGTFRTLPAPFLPSPLPSFPRKRAGFG